MKIAGSTHMLDICERYLVMADDCGARSTMLWRAILAVLALPGIVAGLIPYVLMNLDPWRRGGVEAGLIILSAGVIGFLWCVRDFYVAGKGTLAPWAPPERLVVKGLYRFTRNPMYVSVLMIVAGWGLAAGSLLLAVYIVGLCMAFHLRVVRYEEPRLARQFGFQWKVYAAHVPRWMPRWKPWKPS
ncbi:MAG: isoprenylcysteine carboxylmethyltransferase family protein [Acidobacteria bacterium]|nr:MAG: isoprenylcysteine carboxylmethyltransferase family protein [Acidobacteriota bacterium]